MNNNAYQNLNFYFLIKENFISIKNLINLINKNKYLTKIFELVQLRGSKGGSKFYKHLV